MYTVKARFYERMPSDTNAGQIEYYTRDSGPFEDRKNAEVFAAQLGNNPALAQVTIEEAPDNE